MTLSDWLDESTPDRREVVVCFDRRLVSELVQAKEELEAIENDDARPEPMLGDGVLDVRSRIDELSSRVLGKSRTFVFEGLGWGAWRDLMAKHPPAEEQSSVFRQAVQLGFMPHAVENVTYNAETFIPAALAASCIEPGMTKHEASTLLRKAPPGVIERIWSAVLDANLSGGDDPFVGPVPEGGSV